MQLQGPNTTAARPNRTESGGGSTKSPSRAICGTIKNQLVRLLHLYFTDLDNDVEEDEFFLLTISVLYWVCKDRRWTEEVLASIVQEVWKQLSESAVPVMDGFHQKHMETHCNAAALSWKPFLKHEDPEHRPVTIQAPWLLLYRASLIKLFDALPPTSKEGLKDFAAPFTMRSPYKV